MLSSCTTETHQGVVTYIVAAFDTDLFDGVCHIVRGDVEKALRDSCFRLMSCS